MSMSASKQELIASGVVQSSTSMSEQDAAFRPREEMPCEMRALSESQSPPDSGKRNSREGTPISEPVSVVSGAVLIRDATLDDDLHACLVDDAPPLSPGPYEPASAEVHVKHDETAEKPKEPKAHRLRSFSCCMTIPFGILMVVITLVIAFTVGVTTFEVIDNTHGDAHALDVEVMHALVSNKLSAMVYTAQLLNAMYTPRVTNLEDEFTLSAACRLLDHADPNVDIRSVTAMSLLRNQYAGCMHGDITAPSLHDLFAAGTTNSIANGSWAVDPVTYHLKIPLERWEPVVPELANATDYGATFTDIDDFFAAAVKYTANPSDPELARSVLWRYPSMRPAMLTLTYPMDLYSTQAAVTARIPDEHGILRVRMDTSTLLSQAWHLGGGNTRVVFVTASLYDGTDNPQIASVNWNESISNDTSEWLASVGGAIQNSTRLKDLKDPLVRKALTRLSILDVIKATTLPAHTSTRFMFKGQPCIGTFTRTLSPQGLDQILFVVSMFPDAMGPKLTRSVPIFVCIPICVALVIVTFYFLLHAWFTTPIRHMSQAMLRSSNRGRPRRVRVARQKCAPLPIAELFVLEKVYNDAMMQLRKVDSFLPPSALTFVMPDESAMLSDDDDDDDDTSSFADEAHGDPLFRHRSSGPQDDGSDNKILSSSTLVCTGVTIFPALIVRERYSYASLTGDAEYASLRLPIALTQPSSQPSVGEHLPMPEDVRNGVYPFKSPAELSRFFDSVASLARHFTGQFCYIAPDLTQLFFAEATMRAVHNGANQEVVDRAVKKDALSAVRFCLNLQHWLDTNMADLPRMLCITDTCAYTAVMRHLGKIDMNTFTLVGRIVYNAVGCRIAKLGARVLITEQTATLVHDYTRVIPMQPLTVTPRGTPAFNVVMYEALEGDLDEPMWVQFSVTFRKAFTAMLNGRYDTATELFKALISSPSTRPEWYCPYQRILTHLSTVTESQGLSRVILPPTKLIVGNRLFSRTYQLDRLSTISGALMTTNSHVTFVWFPLRPFYIFAGLDKRPPLAVRLQVVSSPSAMVAGAELASTGGVPQRKSRKPSKRLSVVTHVRDDSLVSRTLGRIPFKTKVRGAGDPFSKKKVQDLSQNRGTSSSNPSGSSSHPGASSTTSTQPPVTVAQTSFRDNFGVTWLLPKVSAEHLDHLEHFRILEGSVLGSNGSLAMVTCFTAAPTAAETLAKYPFEELFPPMQYSEYVEPTIGFHLRTDAAGTPKYFYTISDFSGSNLRVTLRDYGRILPLSGILRGFVNATKGILELHSRGYVHGHIEPEHLLIDLEGRCKIRAYFAGEPVGKLLVDSPSTSYLSPEVIHGGAPTAASDCFACGLVMAEMLTGASAWTWSAAAELQHSSAELASVLVSGGEPFLQYVRNGDIVVGLTTPFSAPSTTAEGGDDVWAMNTPLTVVLARRQQVYPADSAIESLVCDEALRLAADCLRKAPEDRITIAEALAKAEVLLEKSLSANSFVSVPTLL